MISSIVPKFGRNELAGVSEEGAVIIIVLLWETLKKRFLRITLFKICI
jgi:hypothetical protein